MGMISNVVTWARNFTKRLLNSYNADYRAQTFLQKDNTAVAPRHPTFEKLANKILSDNPQLKEELKEIHKKDEKLTEYLKKVYLTSTSQVTGTESKRPKLNKHLKPLGKMYYEPEKPMEGNCTFTNVLEILTKFQEDNQYWNASALARHYKLKKHEVVNLLMYYSLFKNEKFQFMIRDPVETEEEEERREVIEFKSLPALEGPPKQIEQKKE